MGIDVIGVDNLGVDRALDLRNLGPKFGPIPKAKKYVFFPILDEKFPIWQSVFGSGKYQV